MFLCVRMRVVCDCDCVCLFFVLGWVLDCSPSWISSGPPSNVGPVSSPPQSLPVAGVSAWWCISGSRCPELGALVCASSLLVAACWGLGPLALSGLCLGNDVSRVSGSMVGSAPVWMAAGRPCGLVAAAPWGFWTVAPRWLDSGANRYTDVLQGGPFIWIHLNKMGMVGHINFLFVAH
ncbi:hypothetical protein ILYODFUR_031384 [Ilyodon furcidens]|uniref:Uncharacterized protein n=1 Tax=Ilyodon furcidens TaxID=33524 RepID=A0ABV0TZA6_9TELE